jgi:hypothetical protein
LVLGAVSWTSAALLVAHNTGKPLGLDFIQFYTMGRLALTGRSNELYKQAAFSAAQRDFIPATVGTIYHPVYPPQVALMFAPIALLPYEIAAALWTCITVCGYVAVIALVWRHFRRELPDLVLVAAAAIVFPPFWHVVLFGQNSVLILVVFFLAWRALENRQSFLAGTIFGLLAIKPQLAIPLVVVVLICREWAMLGGIAVSLAVQALSVAVVFGNGILGDYARQVSVIVSAADQLEPLLYKSMSLRTLTRLAPAVFGLPAWLVLISLVLVATARAWISAVPVHVRVGIVALAAVLVSPHLIVYDALLLALPLLWCGAWVEAGRGPARRPFWLAVYGLFLGLWLMMPAAVAIGPAAATVSTLAGVLILFWIFLIIVRSVNRPVAPARPGQTAIEI